LPFALAEIPCLRLAEIIAEKIRAASQRSKIRDLHDLAEVSRRPLERDLIRTLAVLKLWHTGGPGLDFERFRERVQDRRNYDIGDLQHLLRRGQNPDLEGLIRQVVDGYQFLSGLSELEQVVAADQYQRRRDEATQLIDSIV
jgi:Nucleotidyl transferase AbiEii toxin, Type IV TA system